MTLEFSRATVAGLLVTLAEAKAHLHITGTDHDADITEKLEEAQEHILARLGSAGDFTWTDTTAPRQVRNAIKLLLDAFYERRGGDEGGSDSLQKALDTIDQLLGLIRDPTIA
jgi:Phage gp6-like head-tail connector protein